MRELKGTVRSAVLFTEGDMITADKLEFEETPLPGEASLSLKSEEAEKKQILRALEQANGNRSLAAEQLGIGRTTLYGKMNNTASSTRNKTRLPQAETGCPTSEELPSGKAFGE